MIKEGIFQLLLRKGRMTINELLEKINAFGFDVDQYDVSVAVAKLQYKDRVMLHSLSDLKCDPDARRLCREAIYSIPNRH